MYKRNYITLGNFKRGMQYDRVLLLTCIFEAPKSLKKPYSQEISLFTLLLDPFDQRWRHTTQSLVLSFVSSKANRWAEETSVSVEFIRIRSLYINCCPLPWKIHNSSSGSKRESAAQSHDACFCRAGNKRTQLPAAAYAAHYRSPGHRFFAPCRLDGCKPE